MSQTYCCRLNVKAPRHHGRERGRPCWDLLFPEKSSNPSTTNQIIHQQSNHCWLFQTQKDKLVAWKYTKAEACKLPHLAQESCESPGKGFIIIRCHPGHSRGVKLYTGWLIAKIQKEEAKKNRGVNNIQKLLVGVKSLYGHVSLNVNWREPWIWSLETWNLVPVLPITTL